MSGLHTPGTALPWQWDEMRFRLCHSVPASHSDTILCAHDEAFRPSEQDAAYIVHACNTLPALQAHADALEAALVDILAWYHRMEGKEPGSHTAFGRATATLAAYQATKP